MRDEDGSVSCQELDFIVRYNPNIQDGQMIRFFAKLIDLSFFISLNYLFFEISTFISFIRFLLVSISLCAIYRSVIEHYLGTTIGKSIFKLRIVDDQGRWPNFFRSLCRNVLAIFNLIPGDVLIYSSGSNPYVGTTRLPVSMNLNNSICKTYVVYKDTVDEIRDRLKMDQT